VNANPWSGLCVGVTSTLLMACVASADVFNMGEGLTSLEWVTVGNPGNAPDTRHHWESGAVSYTYRIGKFEVTAGQYTEFLNAVARTDTYGLYNADMGTWSQSNIQRSGSPGSYEYTCEANWVNRPVNYVTWMNAARFANWLTNGQPSGVQDGTTTDQGGNVYEWTETPHEQQWSRFTWGGSFISLYVEDLSAWHFHYEHPIYTDYEIGFRLAEVPEPTPLMLLGSGGLALLRRETPARNRHRRNLA